MIRKFLTGKVDKLAGPCDGELRRGRAVEDDIGQGAFLVKRPLGCFSRLEVVSRPPPGGGAGFANARRGVYEGNDRAKGREAGFNEERDVPHHGGNLRADGGKMSLPRLGDERVEQRLETLSLGRVGKNDAGDGTAVERAVGSKHAGPGWCWPPRGKGLQDLRPLVKLGDDAVGGKHMAAGVGEETGVRGLAGGDAAGKADDRHARG